MVDSIYEDADMYLNESSCNRMDQSGKCRGGQCENTQVHVNLRGRMMCPLMGQELSVPSIYANSKFLV